MKIIYIPLSDACLKPFKKRISCHRRDAFSKWCIIPAIKKTAETSINIATPISNKIYHEVILIETLLNQLVHHFDKIL